VNEGPGFSLVTRIATGNDSKATGKNFVAEAMRRMLGERKPIEAISLDLDYVRVKAPMFSFSRIVGADPVLAVEMASTGEVGCFGDLVSEVSTRQDEGKSMRLERPRT